MKILLCMDSWKGSLSALQACEAVAAGIQSVMPDAECIPVPMADGGEGTQELFDVLLPGATIEKEVQGPLEGMRIRDGYLSWPESKEALIEMARCAGLPLLNESERNPLKTTTYGVGQWMKDAQERGSQTILLAVGGSATVDGGVGMAQALGWQFKDKNGNELGFGGGELLRLDKIIPPAVKTDVKVKVLCDVTNPLLGAKGSAAVFGPQKGADTAMVQILETGLTRLADCIRRDVGIEVADLPGGGAAGGIAAAAVAFCGAELVSGVEEIMRIADLPAKAREADWILTGEGRVDSQSLDGKVLSGVLHAAGNKPVIVIAGSCDLSEEECKAAGIKGAFSANYRKLPLAEAMTCAEELAMDAGKRFALEFL